MCISQKIGFEICKKYLDSLGKEFVIGGFLVPSTDKYVEKKLGKDAISLKDRNKMIEMSIKSSEWIMNYSLGSADPLSAATKLKVLIESKYEEVKDLKIRIFCGADNTLKTKKYKKGTTITVARKGYTEELKKMSKEFHPDFILIEDDELQELSSTLIRDKMKNKVSRSSRVYP
jgi:nicotinic acid mononucleotide adenylyltransferase